MTWFGREDMFWLNVTDHLGEAPVSRFGTVTKKRAGRTKRSQILDVRCPNLVRILLPRLLDMAVDVLVLCAAGMGKSRHDHIEFFVLDIKCASWQLPLAPSERKVFVAELGGSCTYAVHKGPVAFRKASFTGIPPFWKHTLTTRASQTDVRQIVVNVAWKSQSSFRDSWDSYGRGEKGPSGSKLDALVIISA